MENIRLEAGKFYRTADGRKAFVVGRNHPFDRKATTTTYPFYGFIEGQGLSETNWWTQNGGSFGADTLIAEWVEPKRIKGWVSVDANGMTSRLFETRAGAIDWMKNPGACIEIDVRLRWERAIMAAPRPTTVPIEQYEAAQDCLMKALLGAFGKNGSILGIAVEKAAQKGIIELSDVDGETSIKSVDWQAAS